MNVRCNECNKIFEADVDPYDTHLTFTCPNCEMEMLISEIKDRVDSNLICTVDYADGIYTLYTNLVYLSREDLENGIIRVIESYGHELKGIYCNIKRQFILDII
jgi:phage FluMu protein Com